MIQTRTSMVGGLALCAGLTCVAHADVIFSDTTFLNTNWVTEVFTTGGTGGSVLADQSTVGNPAPSRRHLISAGDAGATVHAFSRYGTTQNVGRYVPTTQGAIGAVSFSMEYAFQSGAGAVQDQALRFALKQGNTIFVVDAPSTSSGTQAGTWLALASGGLTQNHFINAFGSSPLRPDFSDLGAPIRFGWMSTLTNTGNAVHSEVAFDNWSVTISPVPTPGAIALAACGAAMVARRKRKPR